MRSDLLKGVALLGVSFLIVAVAIVNVIPPANQYEISLYDAYPGYFWLFVVGAMFAGTLVIVGSVRRPGDRSWVFGLLLVLVTNGLLLLMPYIRGYQMYGRSDAMSHLGFVQDIVNTGGIDGNIYPPIHLLVLAVADMTGAEPMTVAILIPPIFSAIYFGAMFYLLCFLFDTRERILFGLPFVMLPVLGHVHAGLRPFDLSIMLVPFVLYLLFKSQRNPTPRVRSPFVVSLVGLLLYHPLTALFVVGVFSLYFGGRAMPGIRNQYITPTNVFSLSAVAFLAWYTNFTGIILRFDRVYETLFGMDESEAPVDAYTGTVEQASPALIDLIRIATFRYGIEFLLFGLGFAFLGVALLLFLRQEYILDTNTTMLAGTLVLFSFGGLFFLLTDLIVPHERPFRIATIGAVVLSGQLFYLLWGHSERIRHRQPFHTVFRFSIVVVLLLLVTLSVFGLYHSPLASESNHQVTEMEVKCAEWLTEHGTAAGDLSEFGMSYRRFYEAQHGTAEARPFWGTAPPDHFGYTEHGYLGESYTADSYLTITRQGRIVYPEAFPNYPEHWRFTSTDFERLEQDITTTRIYDNGGTTQYLVRGTGE